MNFHDSLIERTTTERDYLFDAPILNDLAEGHVTRDSYIAFLANAYHHVRHTVPLLMACGARLPDRLDWLRMPVADYIEEEAGHEQWILDDLRACEADVRKVREGEPSMPIELLVSYVHDRIARVSPVSVFGMVLVLEGTSVQLARSVADVVQQRLGLPDEALTYLRSHGALDIEHLQGFRALMDKLYHPEDREAVVHTARVVYRLYGDMLRQLPRAKVALAA